MGRQGITKKVMTFLKFQPSNWLELIYCFTFIFHRRPIKYLCYFPVGLSLLIQHFQQVLWMLKFLLSSGLDSWQLEFKSLIIAIVGFKILFVAWPGLLILEFKSLFKSGLACKIERVWDPPRNFSHFPAFVAVLWIPFQPNSSQNKILVRKQ